jgi:hypothetical protein
MRPAAIRGFEYLPCGVREVRVVLFTGEEPLYLPRYLAPVFERHADALEAVVIAPPPRPRSVQLRRLYDMYGPVDFARMAALVARGRALDALDAVGGLGRRLAGRYHSVARLAAAHDVPVEHASDVDDPRFVDRVRELDPELIVSVVAGQKLGADLLAVPDDAVNLHGSLLPKYRGRAVAFWPLYYGDDRTGVTAHLMTAEWDAGPIVEQRSFPIAPDDTVHDVYLTLADVGGDLACDLLDRYPTDFESRPNESTPSDYHTLPTPAERRTFEQRGNTFL